MNFDVSRLKDPLFFAENRIAAHSDHVAYASMEELSHGETSLRCSLNGLWKFHHALNAGQVIPGFEAADYDSRGWADIRVPAHIQMEGYGAPQYANIQYPWDGYQDVAIGEIPTAYNPVACYIKTFFVPEQMADRRVFVSFQGAESCIAVWLNGHYVGFSGDSFTPSEFELTDYLVEGENKLACRVERWSAGSWLEDQDFWRMSGLFRSVELFTKPELHLEDVFVKQDFAPDFSSATVTFDCKVSGAGTVSVVFDGEEQSAEVGEPAEYDSGVVFGKGEADPDVEEDVQDVSFTFTVEHPALWSAEQPNLYEAEIALLRDGALVERTGLKVGLRRFELKGRQMLLNGQRIVFKGVNRHEWSCRTGRTVSREEMLWDVKNLKAHNVNAVRTSHYPQSQYFLDECDRRGLLVFTELPGWQHIGDDNWKDAACEMLQEMLLQNRNHPSIILWGVRINESVDDDAFYTRTNKIAHQLDPSRATSGVRYHRRAAGNAGTLFSLQGSRCAGLPAGCREIWLGRAAAGLQGQIRLVYAAL